jgi:hypothetical protein
MSSQALDGRPSAMERYVSARMAWSLHCDECRECKLAAQFGDPTDCKAGDEIRSRMDHFRLEAHEVSR